ncbi:hypothetical protein BD779DRAFT_1472892 [Infundibulicybe gibba]|nr:hypothetical protein BD779DRAFT_1472892 [Infundibulicybe gibba]
MVLHVVLSLKTVKCTKQLRLGPMIYMLMGGKLAVGGVIYIEAKSFPECTPNTGLTITSGVHNGCAEESKRGFISSRVVPSAPLQCVGLVIHRHSVVEGMSSNWRFLQAPQDEQI